MLERNSDDDRAALVVANFAARACELTIQPLSGEFELVLGSDEARWGGTGAIPAPERLGAGREATLVLAAGSGLLYRRRTAAGGG